MAKENKETKPVEAAQDAPKAQETPKAQEAPKAEETPKKQESQEAPKKTETSTESSPAASPAATPATSQENSQDNENDSESGGFMGFIKGMDWDSLASAAGAIKDVFSDSDEKNKQSMQEILTTLQSATADKDVLKESFSALESLSFKDLIGQPIKAAIEAQAEAAKSTLDFVNQLCVSSDDGSQKVAVVSFEFFKNGKKARINLPLLSLVNIPSLEIKSMTYKFTAKIDSHSSLIVSHGDSPVKSTSGSVGNGDKKADAAKGQEKKTDEKKADEKKGDDTAKSTEAKTEAKPEAKTEAKPETKTEAKATDLLSGVAKNTTIAASYTTQTGTGATKDSKYAASTTMDISITVEPDEIPGGIKTMLSILDGAIEVINPNGELTVATSQVALSNGFAIVAASYRDPDGICTPACISCSGAEAKKQPIVMMNSEGANIIFSEPGLYTVTAGKLSQPVIVTEG